MFGSPVVTPPGCTRDLNQGISDARPDAVARSIRGRLRHRRHARVVDVDGEVFRPSGEDVGQAFRF